MTSQSRKHRGYATQRIFAEYIRKVFPFAEPTGAGRQGRDILSTPGVWFELKARTKLNPKGDLRQTHAGVEKESAPGVQDDLPILVTRLNGQGPESVGEWVAFMRVDTLIELLNEAGYGTSG